MSCSDLEKAVRILCRLSVSRSQEEKILLLPIPEFNYLSLKVSEVVLNGKVMTPNEWLELAFHFCKQRWDDSVDWLEKQPMSKILVMVDIQVNYANKMKEDAKNKGRR